MSSKNKLSLTVQYADASLAAVVTRPLLRRWVQAALLAPAALTLRFVAVEEARQLNADYRKKDYATNVLTFAYADDIGGTDDTNNANNANNADNAEEGSTRADIVFCSQVLAQEAADQGKTLLAHAAHLVVHGVLHAQGYDHEDDAEASEMETLEIEILAGLGLPNPYLDAAAVAGSV